MVVMIWHGVKVDDYNCDHDNVDYNHDILYYEDDGLSTVYNRIKNWLYYIKLKC